MIAAIAVFVMTLWVLQVPAVWSDRAYRESLVCTSVPSRIRARERFENSVERAGYRVIGPHPLQGRLVRGLVRTTTLQKWLPVVIVFILHRVAGLSSVSSGLLLATYFTLSTAMTDFMFTATGHRAPESGVVNRQWPLLAPALIAQIVLYSLGFSTAFRAVGHWADDPGLVTIGMMALAIVLLGFGHFPVLIAVRLARRREPKVLAGEAPEECVLYLRPFGDDRSRISWPNNIGFLGRPWAKLVPGRFEELLTSAAMREGTLIAIGRPGETLPELGASRTYCPDADWRQVVANSAHRSARVLTIAGRTEGIRWEMESLRSWGLLRKVLLLIPPGTPEATQERLSMLIDVLGLDPGAFDDFEPEFLVAVGFDRNDCPMFFTAAGRTWGAYFAAVNMHLLYMVDDPFE